jgi:hypothetical protein
MNRSFDAYRHFTDLHASVQNSFPGFDTLLKVAGTEDVVASQEELFFAYTDKAAEAPVLLLDLVLSKSIVKKRKRTEVEGAAEIAVTKRAGPWKNGEIEMFKAGVKVFINFN